MGAETYISDQINFLLVDDYSSIRTIVKDQLRYFGFKGKIIEAESAEEGIEILEKRNGQVQGEGNIHVIFSDWNMPGMNGLEFLKWTKAQPYLQKLPFLILTTESEKMKIVDAISNGASNYLIKPWTKKELSEKLARSWRKAYPESGENPILS
jgi:CheY-like chemotaxis protein